MQELEIPATVGSLDLLNAVVRELAVEAALPEREAYQLRLAAEELFTNIVRHGYGVSCGTVDGTVDGTEVGRRPELRVVIEAGVTEQDVWLRLIDSAAPFDPFGVPVREAPGRLPADVEAETLGLNLVRHAVDSATHEYVDGTNRTTVHVRRRVSAGGSSSRE